NPGERGPTSWHRGTSPAECSLAWCYAPSLLGGRKPMTNHRKAILAGGCFWGMQDLIRKQPGVISTRVGYTGGNTPNATYRNHGTHAEGIEIVFDTAETSYRHILVDYGSAGLAFHML